MTERNNKIGRHLPTSGGLKKTLEKAGELGCETVQVFVSNPQGWAVPKSRPDAEAFAEGAREMGLSPVVVHAKYLINLASQNEEQRDRSVEALAHELVAAGSIGADLVVVHSGSHGGDGEKIGLERLVEGFGKARERAGEIAGSGQKVAEPVLENSVGAGTQLCSEFGALAEVSRRAGVKVCVDTAHAFVAGYDLSTPEGAGEVAEELRTELGSGVALVHLNDARNEFGSHRDGHRRIGEGHVPQECWTSFFGGLPGIPVVMETPFGTPEVDAEQIRLVKDLTGGLPNSSG
ncbi:MAG: deoxyribonuclease IV [Rubrobacteraceae bacterium]